MNIEYQWALNDNSGGWTKLSKLSYSMQNPSQYRQTLHVVTRADSSRLRHQTMHMQIFSNIKVSSMVQSFRCFISASTGSFLILSNIIFFHATQVSSYVVHKKDAGSPSVGPPPSRQYVATEHCTTQQIIDWIGGELLALPLVMQHGDGKQHKKTLVVTYF